MSYSYATASAIPGYPSNTWWEGHGPPTLPSVAEMSGPPDGVYDYTVFYNSDIGDLTLFHISIPGGRVKVRVYTKLLHGYTTADLQIRSGIPPFGTLLATVHVADAGPSVTDWYEFTSSGEVTVTTQEEIYIDAFEIDTSVDAPYLMRSSDTGATFNDITPSEGAPTTRRALQCDFKNENHLIAIVGDKILVTDDASVVTPVYDERQTGITGALAPFRIPFNSVDVLLLADGKVYWTGDDFVTLVDKTGDLTVVNPRSIVPVWR